MGGLLCPCSRNNVKLKETDMDDKDESHEPILHEDPNKESTTLKVGQQSKDNNIAWKYGALDKNQQNNITDDNNNSKSKSPKYGNKGMASFDQLLKKKVDNNDNENNENNDDHVTNNNNNYNDHIDNNDDNENEESENSDISDLSTNENTENVSNGRNVKNVETLPKTLPISTETISISNAGFEPINGEYRWFMQLKKWCLFREDNSYCIENNVNVQNVYTQLLSSQNKNSNFRWKETIDSCWIIADVDGSTIYYASPELDNKTIPNCQWISVHGNKPLPILSNVSFTTS